MGRRVGRLSSTQTLQKLNKYLGGEVRKPEKGKPFIEAQHGPSQFRVEWMTMGKHFRLFLGGAKFDMVGWCRYDKVADDIRAEVDQLNNRYAHLTPEWRYDRRWEWYEKMFDGEREAVLWSVRRSTIREFLKEHPEMTTLQALERAFEKRKEIG